MSSKHLEAVSSFEAPQLLTSKGEERKNFYISSKFKNPKKAKSKNIKLFKKRNLDQLSKNK